MASSRIALTVFLLLSVFCLFAEALRKYINLNEINKGNGQVVYCDSKPALEAIIHGHSGLTQEIHRLLETIDQMGKTCALQWMPAHVGIDGNEAADTLAKESRDLNNNTTSLVTLADANAIARYRLKEKTIRVDQQICEIDANREITKTITRLRTGHLGGMKINADNTRTYVKCGNCPEEELSPSPIFNCPAILTSLQNIGAYPFDGDLYTENIVELARAVTKAHGSI